MQIVDRCRNGPGFHGDGEGGASVQEMLIPASKVGLVIGRGGDTIKQLQVIDRMGHICVAKHLMLMSHLCHLSGESRSKNDDDSGWSHANWS